MKRSELHALVWQVPMSALAQRFDRSDTALRNRCRKYNIPCPTRGDWARKELSIIPLPAGEDVDIGLEPRGDLNRPRARRLATVPAAKNPLASPAEPGAGSALADDLPMAIVLLNRDAQQLVHYQALQHVLADVIAALDQATGSEADALREWLRAMEAEVRKQTPAGSTVQWVIRRFAKRIRGR